jgi:putative ABC transport system permease protein
VLGFYDGETNRYVFRENIILTVLGALLGLPMGTLLHAYVMGQIKIDLMCFDVRVAPLSYLISAALTLVFVNLALRRKIRAIDMSQALKSIE